jgi:hypothetical protein
MSKESTNVSNVEGRAAHAPVRPAVLWAGTNTYDQPHLQRQLKQERHTLQRLFQTPDRPDPLAPAWLYEAPQDQIFFGDLLRHHHHDAALRVLHLSGFCLGQYLHLQGGLGEEAWSPQQFAHMISRLPGLQLVFLNGCATKDLLLALLRKDIPAIIATQAETDRTDHLHLAYRFYQSLLRGDSLGVAFRHMQRLQQRPFAAIEVCYDLDDDRFAWCDPSDQPDLAWGLYWQSHHHDMWEWQLCPQTSSDTSAPHLYERSGV